jgi:heptaprenyl diphosphate synthase
VAANGPETLQRFFTWFHKKEKLAGIWFDKSDTNEIERGLMFSNADIHVATAVLQWANEHLCTPNGKMRRAQAGPAEAVCPFVKPSLAANSFYVDVRREINGLGPGPIVETMLEYREKLRAVPPFSAADQALKTIIIVFPEISAEAAPVLDVVHSQIKSTFVHDGLMATQCYPGCDMRSVRNPELRAYDSPYPLMAMRMMAIHDILFVGDCEEWFSAYSLRFGGRFRDARTLKDYEQPLLEEYSRAKARFVK